MPGPPKTGNPVLKFAIILVLLAVIGVVGYNYVPGLVSRVQDMGTSNTPAGGKASSGAARGPLGEVDGTMDVSDTLDGRSPSRPPPVGSRQPAAAKQPTSPATNSAAKATRQRPQ